MLGFGAPGELDEMLVKKMLSGDHELRKTPAPTPTHLLPGSIELHGLPCWGQSVKHQVSLRAFPSIVPYRYLICRSTTYWEDEVASG